ncbi:MAG TPA: GGDEF domain-containing protein [Cellvibrionaceae bacterium]
MADSERTSIHNNTLAMVSLLLSLLVAFIWAALLFADGSIVAWQQVDAVRLVRDLVFSCASFALLILAAFLPVRRPVAVRLSLGAGLLFFGAWHLLVSVFIVDASPLLESLGAGALALGSVILADGLYQFGKVYRLSRLLLGSYRKIEYSLSTTDQLTLLFNRRYFFSTCPTLLLNARKHDEPVCLILLTLENLPTINHDSGHAVGDCVLSEIGKLITRYTRRQDINARISSRRFGLFLPSTQAPEANEIAARLNNFARKVTCTTDTGETLVVEVKMLIAVCEAAIDESLEQLVERAMCGAPSSRLSAIG